MHHRNRLCITFVFHGAQGSSCLFMVHLHAASVSWLVEAAKALCQVEVTAPWTHQRAGGIVSKSPGTLRDERFTCASRIEETCYYQR